MTAALEDVKIIDIEEWLSLATAPSSTKLKPGQTPDAKNVWVDEKPGSVITAPGYIKVGTLPSGNPCTFCINFFRTSAGTQTFVASDNSTVYTTIDFQNWTTIITGLSSVFQLRGLVIRDKLWLTNGSDSVRTYDGTTVTVLDGNGGTPNVPKGRFIAYHDERVWVGHIPSNRSQVAFSALTDASANIIAPDNASAWPSSNTLQVSEGDADFLTGMILYRGYLHFFKQYSIWRLVGYDEYTYTRVKTRASTGTRFNESLQILDSLVHLIGIDGIYVFDGEETERISDLIDPATASQTAFGFNQLQQPNTNNQFWEVTATADWNAGTVPANSVIDDSLTLEAADSGASFDSGTKTNVQRDAVNTNNLVLSVGSSGASNRNVASGASGTLTPANNTGTQGVGSQLTDGDITTFVGFPGSSHPSDGTMTLTLTVNLNCTKIILRHVVAAFAHIYFKNNGSQLTPSSVNNGAAIVGNLVEFPAFSGSPTDFTITFPAFVPNTTLDLVCDFIPPNTGFLLTEIEVYTAAYSSTGNFVSRTLDLGEAPHSYGTFSADVTIPANTNLTYATQSSSDGSSWDAEVACTNGGTIGSSLKRYLRWKAYYTSDGSDTPIITAAYLPSQYISAIHYTGGSTIFSWGPFEADRTLPLQCNFYYRGATTFGGVSGAAWNLIVPGGVLSLGTAIQYIQFKFEIINGDITHLPVISSVTLNWVVGTGVQSQVLQNVASFVWRNRYWMAAAGPSATENDTVLVRGKKTFGSPWQLKDFPLLSFTRYQDSLYAGSSQDGSIFQIDTGYSKNGLAIDSYFETGDFTFGGFYINPIELLVEVERKGPYNLTVGYSIDRGNTWTDKNVDLTISTFAPSYTKKLNIDGTTDRIRFRVRTNAADQPFEVHRMIFYYRMESARGSIK